MRENTREANAEALRPGQAKYGQADDELLTVPEVAKYLNWAIGTVYHRLNTLPGVVHLSRRSVRVWKSALVDWAIDRTSRNEQQKGQRRRNES